MGAEKSTPELVKEFKDSRRKKMNQHYYNPFEEGFKKIQYNRYADDFVIGVIGSKKDAEKIKEDVKIFLKEKRIWKCPRKRRKSPIPVSRYAIWGTISK